jgi:hypothetical protein
MMYMKNSFMISYEVGFATRQYGVQSKWLTNVRIHLLHEISPQLHKRHKTHEIVLS